MTGAPGGRFLPAGVVGRQTESKDLHFGMLDLCDELLRHHTRVQHTVQSVLFAVCDLQIFTLR